MPPGKIMLIRHGEKPPPDGASEPFGVCRDGRQNGHALTVDGWLRASALARFFDDGIAPGGVTTPSELFAPARSDDPMIHRTTQTLLPLSERLGRPIRYLDVPDDQEGEVLGPAVDAIRASTAECVVVCWRHVTLQSLTTRLMSASDSHAVPKWPDTRFDLVWLLDRVADTDKYEFSAVNQGLMPGDAPR